MKKASECKFLISAYLFQNIWMLAPIHIKIPTHIQPPPSVPTSLTVGACHESHDKLVSASPEQQVLLTSNLWNNYCTLCTYIGYHMTV